MAARDVATAIAHPVALKPLVPFSIVHKSTWRFSIIETRFSLQSYNLDTNKSIFPFID